MHAVTQFINLMCMFLKCGRKLEYSDEIQIRHRENVQTPHRKLQRTLVIISFVFVVLFTTASFSGWSHWFHFTPWPSSTICVSSSGPGLKYQFQTIWSSMFYSKKKYSPNMENIQDSWYFSQEWMCQKVNPEADSGNLVGNKKWHKHYISETALITS